MRKAKQVQKAKHYQLSWNVFHAVDVVGQYEAQTGDKSGVLPYPVLAKIYKGNLMPALQLGTIVNHQTKDEWLSMMDDEFKDDMCLDAWAVANCLVRAKA